jgi:hypothetical protein
MAAKGTTTASNIESLSHALDGIQQPAAINISPGRRLDLGLGLDLGQVTRVQSGGNESGDGGASLVHSVPIYNLGELAGYAVGAHTEQLPYQAECFSARTARAMSEESVSSTAVTDAADGNNPWDGSLSLFEDFGEYCRCCRHFACIDIILCSRL